MHPLFNLRDAVEMQDVLVWKQQKPGVSFHNSVFLGPFLLAQVFWGDISRDFSHPRLGSLDCCTH